MNVDEDLLSEVDTEAESPVITMTNMDKAGGLTHDDVSDLIRHSEEQIAGACV